MENTVNTPALPNMEGMTRQEAQETSSKFDDRDLNPDITVTALDTTDSKPNN